jgi:N-ethylmaleimide reductase
MSDSLLFSPFQLGRIALKNRIVMAPMTRNRSIGNVPGELVATYYGQRATAGLIITEGTSPSPNGVGYARIPGLYNEEQVAGWRAVADAVHASGGRIFVQLMHTGRASHADNLPAGAKVVGPSAITLPSEIYVDGKGNVPATPPHALTEDEIDATLNEYARAAELAIAAGCDGVELHGANGYLIDQFLNVGANQRTDRWGGSLENRMRFALEAARRCIATIGADRVGIRLSPYGVFNGMTPDPDMEALYLGLSAELGKLGLAYIHIVDHSSMGAPRLPEGLKAAMKASFGGTLITSGGYDRARAEADLASGVGELVAFGRPFISNPNLVEKLRTGAPLVAPDFATFYTPGPAGYTDYPA